jgi:ABC-2 type transport system permease protein
MNPKIIAVDFIASLKSWYRSRGTLFWSLLFPIMLILIFGAIFSGVGNTKYTLPVQDLDDSSWSHTIVGTLSNISVFKSSF